MGRRLNQEEITERFIRLGELSDPVGLAERALWHAAAGDTGLLEIDFPEVVARFPKPSSNDTPNGNSPPRGGEFYPKRKRKRRPTLASVARQATKGGIEVARYEVDPESGRIIVVPGKPDIAPTDRNEWDSVQ